MQYFVSEIADSIDLLQAHLDDISNEEGVVISVIWRETDRLYVVVHGVGQESEDEVKERH